MSYSEIPDEIACNIIIPNKLFFLNILAYFFGRRYKLNYKTMSTTQTSRVIKASPEKLYQAFTSPEALEVWMAPGEMTGKVRHFDLREGGSYEMSLFYPDTDKQSKGKSGAKEDRYSSRFVELQPNKKIVEAVRFDSPDPRFAGEMIMEVTFEPLGKDSRINMVFKNIPDGISPEDNEKGTELSLEKLAKYVEGK
jgi:uncharacterized protein YndB with AHSA1/START domain